MVCKSWGLVFYPCYWRGFAFAAPRLKTELQVSGVRAFAVCSFAAQGVGRASTVCYGTTSSVLTQQWKIGLRMLDAAVSKDCMTGVPLFRYSVPLIAQQWEIGLQMRDECSCAGCMLKALDPVIDG